MKNSTMSLPPVVLRLGIILLLAGSLLAMPALAQSPAPDFSKAFNPSTIGPGSVSTLTFTIANTNGAGSLRDLAFDDTLPAGVTIASPANASTDCIGGTVNAVEGGNYIELTNGGVGGGSTCTVSVDVTSDVVGTHTNVSGDLTSAAGNSGSATANLTVATNRPGFSKSFSPSAVFFGNRSTLTFTIDNTLNSSTAFNLNFTDNLPSGMEVANPSNASTDCTGGTLSAAPGGSVISYSFNGFVAAGASCTVVVDVLGNAVGSLGNTSGELFSTATGPSVSSGKAAATLTVTVEQIALLKEFTDDPVPPGGQVTVQYTVLNLDRRSSASNIAFSDDFDAALSGLQVASLPAGACGGTLAGTSVLTLSGGSLPAEGSCTFSVSLQVPAGAAAGGYPSTTSAITADVGGRPATGNPASDTLFVSAAPSLAKTFTVDPVGAGGTTTIEFTVTNTSATSSATDITFTDELTTFLPFPVSATLPANGFCGAGSSMSLVFLGSSRQGLLVSGGSLAAGASCTFSADVVIPVGLGAGTYTNTTGEISATVGGRTVTGNAASASFTVVAAPALAKEFTDDPVPAGGTGTLEFTLTHGENGGGTATDIAFTDDLNAALTGMTTTGLPASVCNGGTLSDNMGLSLTGASLAVGASCSFSVTIQVPAGTTPGTYTNTTSNVSATVLGVSAGSQPASADLQVAGLTWSKEFVGDPVLPGDTLPLRFTITNLSSTAAATDINFTDNLGSTLTGLAAPNLPLTDPCGAGSSVGGAGGGSSLIFTGGALDPLGSCTFDVDVLVPSTAAGGDYFNATSPLTASIDGGTVTFDNVSDILSVATELLSLTKEFTDDPVAPGGTVNLRFTLTNLDPSAPATDVAFSDDLDAALSGLSALGLPAAACGGTVSGSGVITLAGGALAAGGTCTFDVTVQVPSNVALGITPVNQTSSLSGTINGVAVTGPPASAELEIQYVAFSKAFDGPTVAGGTPVLTFTIQNLSTVDAIDALVFQDDLGAVLSGLVATNTPISDPCGEGSTLTGTATLVFEAGSLGAGASCSFSVVLSVPGSATPGTYTNVTTELFRFGAAAATPAVADLTIQGVQDSDGDGVLDGADLCPGTTIPEAVPFIRLLPNHWALIDGDTDFDTVTPNGKPPKDSYTIEDTAGCSCEQILAARGLGVGQYRFGCSSGTMKEWVQFANP